MTNPKKREPEPSTNPDEPTPKIPCLQQADDVQLPMVIETAVAPPPPEPEPAASTKKEALNKFNKVLENGPKTTTKVKVTEFWKGTYQKEVQLPPITIDVWIEILTYDKFIDLKLENIICFATRHDLKSPFLKMFEAMLKFRRAIIVFENSLDEFKTLRDGPSVDSKVSAHSENMYLWMLELIELIF